MILITAGISIANSQTTAIEGNDQKDALSLSMSNNSISMEDSLLIETVNQYITEQQELSKDPDKIAAGVLNILLGGIGVGHFYTGQTLRGVLDIVFCWTGVPAIIGLVEGIIWLCEDDDAWAERVAKWNEKK